MYDPGRVQQLFIHFQDAQTVTLLNLGKSHAYQFTEGAEAFCCYRVLPCHRYALHVRLSSHGIAR
jgi:hypothetical protein